MISNIFFCLVFFAGLIARFGVYRNIPMSTFLEDWDYLDEDESTANYLFMTTIVIPYIICLCLACNDKSTRYLYNYLTLKTLYTDVNEAIARPPLITFWCECYHYVIHISTHTDSNGNTTTSTSKQKVVTHTDTHTHELIHWVDKSPPCYTLKYLEHILLTRLETETEIKLSPRARVRFNYEYGQF